MDVSIIIVNYNTEQLILNCIKSINEKTKGISFEIIVVDNASPNEPIILKKDSRIKYIQSKTNLGFGKANNLGAKYAQGNYLHLLNPDTLLINNAIYALWKYMKLHPNVGVAGSNLYKKDLSPNLSYGIKDPNIIQDLFLSRKITKRIHLEEFNYDNIPKQVANVVGASMMISQALFKQVKGFDEDFFMYGEETYLCYVIRKKGYVIMNVPDSKIIHLDGQSFQFKQNKEDLAYEGRKLYLIKRYNRAYYYLYIFFFIINASANAIYLSLKGKKELANIWTYRIKKAIK